MYIVPCILDRSVRARADPGLLSQPAVDLVVIINPAPAVLQYAITFRQVHSYLPIYRALRPSASIYISLKTKTQMSQSTEEKK